MFSLQALGFLFDARFVSFKRPISAINKTQLKSQDHYKKSVGKSLTPFKSLSWNKK